MMLVLSLVFLLQLLLLLIIDFVVDDVVAVIGIFVAVVVIAVVFLTIFICHLLLMVFNFNIFMNKDAYLLLAVLALPPKENGLLYISIMCL